MDHRLNAPWTALKFGIGVTATVAGVDKFFNLLTDWGGYVSPLAAELLPVPISVFMGVVGVIEIIAGVATLAGWTRLGGYVVSAWLLGIAANLVAGGLYDVAVRDVVMSIAAFTLARLTEVREATPVAAHLGSGAAAATPARASRAI